MNPIVKTGGSLLIIAGIAAAALGGVNAATAPTIAQKKEASTQKAMKAVFLPTTASDADIDGLSITFDEPVEVTDNDIINSYSKNSDGGYAFSITTKGFSAGLNLMVGIDKDGTVTGVKVVSHSETPGLGANAETKLSPQFDSGKTAPLTVLKGSGASDTQLEAITGATITSTAVVNAVNEAYEYYENNLKGGNK
ncbi:MAG: RnfABCDGE type electron transport complex subunit G [Firmicutes bacterium]|nr:RnfABCDGE type electron transport complex subunit G [Bacillota bacterium]